MGHYLRILVFGAGRVKRKNPEFAHLGGTPRKTPRRHIAESRAVLNAIEDPANRAQLPARRKTAASKWG